MTLLRRYNWMGLWLGETRDRFMELDTNTSIQTIVNGSQDFGTLHPIVLRWRNGLDALTTAGSSFRVQKHSLPSIP
jgi:hypothetical protein